MCHRLLCLQRGPRFTAIPNSDNVCSHPSIHHLRDPRVQHLFRFSLPIMSDPKTPWGPLARSYSLLKLDNTSNKGPSTMTSIETVPSAAYLSGSTTALFLPPCLLVKRSKLDKRPSETPLQPHCCRNVPKKMGIKLGIFGLVLATVVPVPTSADPMEANLAYRSPFFDFDHPQVHVLFFDRNVFPYWLLATPAKARHRSDPQTTCSKLQAPNGECHWIHRRSLSDILRIRLEQRKCVSVYSGSYVKDEKSTKLPLWTSESVYLVRRD